MKFNLKLTQIQNELKVPKNQFNKFGGYKYRSCEDILEAIKPLCEKYGCTVYISDEIVFLGERYYIKATAKIIDNENYECLDAYGWAREPEETKGMAVSQITGTASSYARKYALNGLFCIDDTKDADTNEYKEQIEQDKVISGSLLTGLNSAIEKANIDDKAVELILSQYGYTNTAEIKMKDYMHIVNDFKKEK